MTSSSTSDLVSRVLAAIEEAERAARNVLSDYADHEASWTVPCTGVVQLGDDLLPTGDGPLAEHIARHDPASVLSRCAADRRVLAEYQDVRHERTKHQGDLGLAGALLALHGVVKRLAEDYGITQEEN